MSIKKITYYISIAALFLIPIFPLIVANSYFFPFITGKAFYFRLLVELAFAAWVILAFLDAKYRPKFTPLTVAVSIFALVALLADLLGVNPLRSIWSNFERMEGWMVIIHLWAFYMVATSLFGHGEDGRKLWHRWLNFSLIVAFFVALYGVFQLLGWAAIHQGSVRVDASLGNSAYMAVYMLFNAFLAAYLFFDFRTKRIPKSAKTAANVWHWAYALGALLFAFVLLETQTRGTILGLVGGILLALTLYAILAKKETSTSRSIAGGIVIFILLLGVVFWFNRHQPFIEKNAILGRFSNISWSESSNQARQYIWPMAVSGAMQRPILGWGQENFNYIFNADYNPVMYSQEQWFDRAHNVFLDWLVASGIVGLIAYLSLYVLVIMAIWKSPVTIVHKSILTGLIAGYFVHNIFVFDNLASYVMFFALLGLVNAMKEGSSVKWLGTKPVRQDAVEYIVAPIVIVALVLVAYFVIVRPVQANTRLIEALRSCGGPTPDVSLFANALSINSYAANQEIREQVLSCTGSVIGNQASSGGTKQAFFALAKKEIEAQIVATPKDARTYTLGGSLMSGVGQFQDALPLLEKAHALSPNKQTISLELASVLLNLGKNDEALVLLKKTYEDAPTYDQAKSAYAMALVLANKEKDAQILFGNDPAIFHTPQMAQVYMSMKQYAKAESIYQDIVKANPKDVNARARLAQIQYSSGQKYKAIETMRSIATDNPELKTQVDAAIKQIQ